MTLAQGEYGVDCVSSSLNTQPLQPDVQLRQQLELVYQIIVFTKLTGSISSTLSFPHFCCCVPVHICLKTLTEDFLNFLRSISSVCPSYFCVILFYAFCTLCLSSFHHDDRVCVLLCLHLSTYSAASSSSFRNFLTSKFLSEEFIKIAYSPPLVDITHFHMACS